MMTESEQRVDVDESSSPPQVPAPEFVNCSIKTEPQDFPPHEEAVGNAKPTTVVKWEPDEEEMKVNVLDTVGGDHFQQTDTEASALNEDETVPLGGSDDGAQLGNSTFKDSVSDIDEVVPEEVKNELKIEDERPPLEKKRHSVGNPGISSAMHRLHVRNDKQAHIEFTSISTGNLAETHQPQIQSWSPTGSAQVGLKINSNTANSESSIRAEECTMSSVSETVITGIHDKKYHLLEHVEIPTGEKLFVCVKCNESFTTERCLENHTRIHGGERQYVCLTCNKLFASRGSLKNHSGVHTGEKPFVCSICNKSFALKGPLQVHLRIHTGEKPYVCFVCNLSFRMKGTLESHSMIHSGEKPHICLTCNKSFSRKQALQEHSRIHTGEKPFVCFTCNLRFRIKGNLEKHSLTHTGEKPHICVTCKKSFAWKGTLKRHLRVHSGEKPYSCPVCSKKFKYRAGFTKHKTIHTLKTSHV